MSQCVIKITSNNGPAANQSFGPFKSVKEASTFLKGKGWISDLNGIKGLWHVEAPLYSGYHARIEPLETPKKLPEWPPWKK